jgi:hypothetical protein
VQQCIYIAEKRHSDMLGVAKGKDGKQKVEAGELSPHGHGDIRTL